MSKNSKKSSCGYHYCRDGYLYFPLAPEVDYPCGVCHAHALKEKSKKNN